MRPKNDLNEGNQEIDLKNNVTTFPSRLTPPDSPEETSMMMHSLTRSTSIAALHLLDDDQFSLNDDYVYDANYTLSSPISDIENDLQHFKEKVMQLSQDIIHQTKLLVYEGRGELDLTDLHSVWNFYGRNHTLSWEQFNHAKMMCARLKYIRTSTSETFQTIHHMLLSQLIPTEHKCKSCLEAIDIFQSYLNETLHLSDELCANWLLYTNKSPKHARPPKIQEQPPKEKVIEGTKWLMKCIQIHASYGGDTPTTPKAMLLYLKQNWHRIEEEDQTYIMKTLEHKFGNSSLPLITENFSKWLQESYPMLSITLRAVIKCD